MIPFPLKHVRREINRFFLTRWYSVSQRVSHFMDVGDWTAQRPDHKNRWGIKNEHPGLRNSDQCCSPRYRFGILLPGCQSSIQESKVQKKKRVFFSVRYCTVSPSYPRAIELCNISKKVPKGILQPPTLVNVALMWVRKAISCECTVCQEPIIWYTPTYNFVREVETVGSSTELYTRLD